MGSPWLWLGSYEDGRRRLGKSEGRLTLPREPWLFGRLQAAQIPEAVLGSYSRRSIHEQMEFRAKLFVNVSVKTCTNDHRQNKHNHM